MSQRTLTRSARTFALAAAALLVSQGAHATTVTSVSVHEMIEGAQVVFEGRVLGRRFVDDGDARHLRTCVRFEVLEVLKGSDLESPLELCFAGGRSKVGITRSIAGLELPAPGERGVYFVESLSPRSFSPFLGWDQGRFLVGRDGGVETAGGRPVVGLDADDPNGRGTSSGVARGARVAEPGARTRGMDVDAFKARVRALAEEGTR